ncbi:MAG: XdhC family protein, partial [Planctomycetales bacterium]|nr:XdhC family protein [Planctomycetales bacterium]
MQETIAKLAETTRNQTPAAWCRLVETRGSTPQKAGAGMLVFADGSQAGTLGGGCVEADVKRQALAAIQSQAAQLAEFQLDSDYGWDDGLICGGKMRVLIDPLVDPQAAAYYARLIELYESGDGGTEAIAFDPAKSGIPVGAACLFRHSGELLAALRGGPMAKEVSSQLRDNL